ncbi:WhiB family transcriptional regulator [Agromyces sp. NPDC058104]|uniref:WhiB family transcriptional regulator n=1 Tax=Agromyces sp. NPDC058104 TaxID=3346342 RepID=UPI0036DD6C5F
MTGEAYATLMAAAHRVRVNCLGDARFTSDQSGDVDLADICSGCPLLEACTAFATSERPAAGFWAGERYPQDRRRRAGGAR